MIDIPVSWLKPIIHDAFWMILVIVVLYVSGFIIWAGIDDDPKTSLAMRIFYIIAGIGLMAFMVIAALGEYGIIRFV